MKDHNLRTGHLKCRLISVSLAFIMMFSVLGITAVHSLEEWVPTFPPWLDTVRLEPISIGENAYAQVWMAFPTAGYDVDWGSVTRIDDSTFSADAEIWAWTSYCAQVVTMKSHIYDLGALPPGVYRFIFKAWGTPIKSLQFTHPLGLENALKLVTLYEVNLDVNFWLETNSKLVVKFYTWGDDFEAENVVWSGTAPDNVILLEDIPHPQGKAVEKAKLDLTHDNTENVISTIASFTVRKVHLEIRFSRIPSAWFLAPPPERTELETEFSKIPSAWFLAPS